MILSIRHATHRYGTTRALDDVEVEVAPGECVALLGPNGAGKTTLIGLATGLLVPQEHTEVRVAGGDPRFAATRRQLGVVQQSVGFPRTLRVGELVRGAAVRAGLSASAAGPALVEAGLSDLGRRRSGKLSGGQQQRLQLGMALVADPSLLLLDEPTVGLDVAARRHFWRTIQGRRDRGVGILVTTHVVEEAAAVADRVVLLHRGRIVASDSPRGLAARLPDRTITARTSVTAEEIASLDDVLSTSRHDGRLEVGTTAPEAIVRFLLDRDPDLHDLRVEGASLEQALLHLTDRADDPAQEVAA
jgi:ABC-2 type transport system ATP-binding protein